MLAALTVTAWLTVRAYRRPMPGAVTHTPDPPTVFGTNMAWLAVRSDDPKKVLELLQLGDVCSVEQAAGLGAVYARSQSDTAIFVSPPTHGWVVVAGLSLPQPLGDGFADKCTPLIEMLGAHFEDVQYFLSYEPLDLFAWAQVSGGRLRRRLAVGDQGEFWTYGAPTPQERALGLKYYELHGVDNREGDAGGAMILMPTGQHVRQLAARWSIDPALLSDEREPGTATGYVGTSPLTWRAQRIVRQAA